MADDTTITLYHAPHSRSSVAFGLFEELGVPYKLHLLNMKAGEQREAAYLAINPMGKVPAILHDGTLVTEQVAIFIHLADLFPEAGLAPPIGDRQRGAYLRWLVFYAACFEPAITDRALQREPGRPMMVPYGDFDTMFATISGALAPGPWLLGERFSAADILWGQSLGWATAFGMLPEQAAIAAYIGRVNARPALVRATAKDAELAAAQAPVQPA